jgi:hypothetical protein
MIHSSVEHAGSNPAATLRPSWSGIAPAASDILFLDLLGRYRSQGGLASFKRVETLLQGRAQALADWIRDGELFCLAWRGEAWLPMFQLRSTTRSGLAPRADVRSLATELRCVCDELDLCIWFVKPNGWLDGRTPVEMIDANAENVRAAARADRFVMGG